MCVCVRAHTHARPLHTWHQHSACGLHVLWHMRVCTTPRRSRCASIGLVVRRPCLLACACMCAQARGHAHTRLNNAGQDARHAPFNLTAIPSRRRTTGDMRVLAGCTRTYLFSTLPLSPGRNLSRRLSLCLFLCPPPAQPLTPVPSLHSRRSSAHFAAWHSPKREREKFGQHFKLDDCRVWMRCAHARADKMHTGRAYAQHTCNLHFI